MKSNHSYCLLAIAVASLTLLAVSTLPCQADSDQSEAFAEAAAKVAEAADTFSVAGDAKGWYFLKSELRQTGLGKFWEQPWADIVTNPGKESPLPYMLEFQKALAEKGVELIIVPIPMKASIYPDKFDESFAPGAAYGLKPLYDQMREQGLDVFDVEPVFAALRATDKLYCEQDAHYSPRTCEILATSLVKKIKAKQWSDELKLTKIDRSEPTEIKINGDLVIGTDYASSTSAETLEVRFAGQGHEPADPDPESPILLLGDSHTLVFQEGSSNGMHCTRAGLLDQMQFELQSRIDLLGQKGSGSVQARKALYGRARSIPGFWENKKLVVWVFSSREFTQSPDKLMTIPIEPK